jgi:hypothetical protein
MFEILNSQILRLKDCAVLINNSEKSASIYHDGEKIVSKTIVSTPYNVLEVVQDPFDSLVLKSLEICLFEESTFVNMLRNYCSGQSLTTVLLTALDSKREIFTFLHLLYQELKLYELMNE